MKIPLLCALFFFPFFSAVAQAPEAVRFITFNIKYDNPRDSLNSWKARRQEVNGLINFYRPDLLGVQEALHHQLKDIEQATGMRFTGVARDDGRQKGEYSGIFYQSARFELLTSGTFWLSPAPEKPSTGWDAALPRTCTWGKFRRKASGQQFYYFNTHFDHVGEQARLESMRLIVRQIADKNTEGLPVVLSGDFNFTPDTAPYPVATAALQDALLISQTGHYGPPATFNGFVFLQMPKNRIDYIFVKGEGLEVLRHATLTNSKHMRYPSDHFPVLADVAF